MTTAHGSSLCSILLTLLSLTPLSLTPGAQTRLLLAEEWRPSLHPASLLLSVRTSLTTAHEIICSHFSFVSAGNLGAPGLFWCFCLLSQCTLQPPLWFSLGKVCSNKLMHTLTRMSAQGPLCHHHLSLLPCWPGFLCLLLTGH